jgi:hypothetical protein
MTDGIGEWIFTFGMGHPIFAGCYIKVFGTYSDARSAVVETFGTKWAFQYDSEEKAGVDEFHLKEIVIRNYHTAAD